MKRWETEIMELVERETELEEASTHKSAKTHAGSVL